MSPVIFKLIHLILSWSQLKSLDLSAEESSLGNSQLASIQKHWDDSIKVSLAFLCIPLELTLLTALDHCWQRLDSNFADLFLNCLQQSF